MKNQVVQAAARWAKQAATTSILIATLHSCCCLALYAATSKPPLASHDNNGSDDDRRAVSAMDTRYQAAVKNNDVEGMGRILADDFILVTSSGKTETKTDLLNEARESKTTYERQEDTDQTVRLWGDTAVVTAKLWAKGTDGGKPFDVKLWFSDTYVRTLAGWKYVFGQASCHLPPAS